MNSMFLKTLEKAFDEYFEKKYNQSSPNAVIYSDPNILADYREELENFAKFLVEEYEQSVTDADY